MNNAARPSRALYGVPEMDRQAGPKEAQRERSAQAVVSVRAADLPLCTPPRNGIKSRPNAERIDYLPGAPHLSVADARSLLGVEESLRDDIASQLDSASAIPRKPDVQAGTGDERRRATHLIGERAHHIYLIEVPMVDYVVVDGNYVTVHVGEEQYLTRATLSYMARCLEEQDFVRIERSILVNLRRVAYIERLERGQFVFVLRGGQRLISARERSVELRALFLNPVHFACVETSCASTP